MNSAQNCRCPEPTCVPEEVSLRCELEEVKKRLTSLVITLNETWYQFSPPEPCNGDPEAEGCDINSLLRAIRRRILEAESYACMLHHRIAG